MANLTNNRINIIIPEADLALLKTHIAAINQLVPQFGLTPSERKSMRGMEHERRAFAEDCIMLLKENGNEMMPPYLDVSAIVTDFNLSVQLSNIEMMLKTTLSCISDAKRLAGNEAMIGVYKAYECYETASSTGIPGGKSSYEQLRKHFDKNTGRKVAPLKKKQ